MRAIAIIPARYDSTRFKGKPLADLCGRPMLWWVYHQVKKARRLAEVWVATDHPAIQEACGAYQIPCKLTSPQCPTSTQRVWEAAQSIPADVYVCVNGDEPLIDPANIDAAVPDEVPLDVEFGTNIIARVKDPAQLCHASNIKVVFDDSFRALYMSRTPVPYPFCDVSFSYYKHVGIIGYNRKMLDFYKSSVPGRLELIEGIDTLRWLDYGKELRLIPVERADSLSVDTEADLRWVRERMGEKRL